MFLKNMEFWRMSSLLIYVSLVWTTGVRKGAIVANLAAEEQFQLLLLKDTYIAIYGDYISDAHSYSLTDRLHIGKKLIERITWFAEMSGLISGVSNMATRSIGPIRAINPKCKYIASSANPRLFRVLVEIYNKECVPEGIDDTAAFERTELINAMKILKEILSAIEISKRLKRAVINGCKGAINEINPSQISTVGKQNNNLNQASHRSEAKSKMPFFKGDEKPSEGPSPAKGIYTDSKLPHSTESVSLEDNQVRVDDLHFAVYPLGKIGMLLRGGEGINRCDVKDGELCINMKPWVSTVDKSELLWWLIINEVRVLSITCMSVEDQKTYESMWKQLVELMTPSDYVVDALQMRCTELFNSIYLKVVELKGTPVGYILYFEHFSNKIKRTLPKLKESTVRHCGLRQLLATASICMDVLSLIEKQLKAGAEDMALYRLASLSKLLLRFLELSITPESKVKEAMERKIWLAINCSLISRMGAGLDFKTYKTCWMIMSFASHSLCLDTVKGSLFKKASVFPLNRSHVLGLINFLAFKQLTLTSAVLEAFKADVKGYSDSFEFFRSYKTGEEDEDEGGNSLEGSREKCNYYFMGHYNYIVIKVLNGLSLKVVRRMKDGVLVRRIMPGTRIIDNQKLKPETILACEQKLMEVRNYINDLVANIDSLSECLISVHISLILQETHENSVEQNELKMIIE